MRRSAPALRFRSLLAIAQTYLALLGEARRRLPLLCMFVLGASVLDVVGVGLIAPFIAVATNPQLIHTAAWAKYLPAAAMYWNHETIVLLLGMVFLLVFLLKTIVSARLYIHTVSFAYRQDTLMRVRVLSSIMYAPYKYHLEKDRAHILNTLVQSINKFSSSLLALIRLLSESVVVVFMLVLLLWASGTVFLVLSVSFLAISFSYFRITRGQAAKWGELTVTSNSEMLKSIQESIEGMKEIRTYGIEQAFLSRLGSAGGAAEQSAIGMLKLSILPRYLLESGLVSVVVALVVFFLLNDGNALELMPLLALVGIAGLRLLPSLNVILSSASVVRQSFPAVSQIRGELEMTSTFSPLQQIAAGTISELEAICLKDLVFRYGPSNPPIFSGLSLKINARQAVGIVGGSGAGKTTLVDLVLGLLTPDEGDVLVNGKSISENLPAWWGMVAYIPQSPFLSDDTIRRNIALGVDDSVIDEQRIDSAISAAQLQSFIGHLAQGKGTVIGDRGIRLSGGQRQRIAIARALYFDRQILIFDEATSALDSVTEAEIVAAIGGLIGKKTMIIIAHRLTTLAYCDRIIEIENGHATEVPVP